MTDRDRLRLTGSDEQRALLRSPDPAVPAELREAVRRAVEDRISPAGRHRAARRLVLTVAGTLVAGGALAYGVVEVRARLAPPAPPRAMPAWPSPKPQALAPVPAQSPPAPQPANGSTHAPPSSPGVASAPEPAAATERAPAGPARHGPSAAAGGPASARAPAVPSMPAWPEAAARFDQPRLPAAPPRAPNRLVIARERRREVALSVDGARISGKVRDTPVSLQLEGTRWIGKIGDENVWVFLHNRNADGTIAGHDVGYELSPTRDGYILRGSVPSHSVRVEIGRDTLSWYPGCDEPLAAVAPGTYEGKCAWGGKARVVIPAALEQLPVLARMILLGILLTERDPRLEFEQPPELFGHPDWPHR